LLLGNGHARSAAALAIEPDADGDSGEAPAPTPAAPPGQAAGQAAMIVGKYRVGRALTETPAERLYQGADPETSTSATFHFYRGVHRAAAVEAWKKAVRAAGRVRHGNIAELQEALVSDKGRPVAVHEALSGVDLGTLLSREQRFDPGLALRLARELCEALAASHAASIVHGALRPTCIFLDGQRKSHSVKLLGFGVTRLYGLTERPLAALVKLPTGILEYLAPEVLRGVTIDPRGDLYGVGALLYEMVTGVPPYAGSREAVERKKQAPPQSPRFFRPDLSPEIESLILRLLAPDASDRPDTAAAVLAAIEPLARAAGPGELPGAGESDEARRRARRQAAFRAIAELAGEVTAGPTLLEAMIAGTAATSAAVALGPAPAVSRPAVPPPLPVRPALSGAAEISGPPPRSELAEASSPAIWTSAVGMPEASPARPTARPALGGMLAHYGQQPDAAPRKRVRILTALVVAAAVAAAVMIKMLTGD
jgi:hypothetical protein